jgi:hypothetical protein
MSWMRHRDMAIVALLLVIAVVSVVLFVRSWLQAGAGARARAAGDRRPPPSGGHLSRTRAVAGDGEDAERRPPA